MGGQALETPGEATRAARSRVELALQQLPGVVWINPAWAMLTALPFTGLFPAFGQLAWWRIALALGLHAANSVTAGVVYRSATRAGVAEPETWLRRIIWYQGLVSAEWGAMAWLLWVPQNTLNHVMVVMSLVTVLWAYSLGRSMDRTVLLASIAPCAAVTALRVWSEGGPASTPLTLFLAVTFGLSFLFAHRARRYFENVTRMRVDNDKLTAELRATRDEALKKRYEAEAANASKTAFLANMSHELRTPLNAILGFSELIAHEALGPVGTARYREYATDINTSGAHLLSLINDILDVAKIEAGRMDIDVRPLDAKAVIEKALIVVAGRARDKSQHLTVDIAAPDVLLEADERALKQIVINLASNAVKFTPEGGRVAVTGGPTAGGGYEICVEDNGPGVAPDMVERIFRPFNQVDNRYNRDISGTGLGLSLVRGLAELHGGRAWIESDLGAGVRAYVYFPVANRDAIHIRARA
ncbi:MAG TPA: HAMP domain-containing sensor histidine kinase [Rhizomicrobium sp.]|nr:HAMP domain-containing sensor histidine kinase [Rhizomicrobium sp.]